MRALDTAVLIVYFAGILYSDGFAVPENSPTGSEDDPEQYDMMETLRRHRSGIFFGSSNLLSERRKTKSGITLEGDCFRLRVRVEREETEVRSLFYTRVDARRIPLRIDAGYFLPDIAMGLVYSGYEFSYPFSTGYPLRKPKWLAGRTSFYGKTIRGMALSMSFTGLRWMIFSGEQGTWSGGRFKGGSGKAKGVRLERPVKGMQLGVTLDNSGGRCRTGIDGRKKIGMTSMSFELCCSESSLTAAEWGFSRKVKNGNAGLALYLVPAGDLPPFGYISGGSGNRGMDRRGISSVFSMKFRRRCRLRFAFEHNRYLSASADKIRNRWRIECLFRAGMGRMRMGWTHSDALEKKTLPFPSDHGNDSEASESLNIVADCHHALTGRMRIACRFPCSENHCGMILSHLHRFESRGKAIKFDITVSWYRSIRGEAPFYIYEPVLKGSYPWKYLRGAGRRLSLLASLGVKRFRIVTVTAWQTGVDWAADCQILYDF